MISIYVCLTFTQRKVCTETNVKLLDIYIYIYIYIYNSFSCFIGVFLMISYYSLFISSYSLFFPIFPIVSHYFLLFPIISPSLHAPLGLGLRGEQERERERQYIEI